ncbi:holo-ACP synthase [Thiomonas sp.]|jgi:holo-[acyl-carrier protein] synthase|uniref:holo-ACP synthase n=1 Tax=Thiomonas sp. TaxID=2047785 RepID=UPI00261071EF|nr:holo-ACP synthase [Thiomonas sp.]
MNARLYGVGTDVCDLRRIGQACERHGERFARRILGPAEQQVFAARRARSQARGIAYLGTRFAAKEALSKALGLGLHMPMSWQACEILNAPGGRPQVRLHGALAAWCAQRGLALHVSISDETDTAVAFVVAEILESTPDPSA